MYRILKDALLLETPEQQRRRGARERPPVHSVIVGSGELAQNTEEMLITKQITHTQKGRSLSPCTCLTVASKDIHYKYIYICTYIYICIYILSFYVHIYYSQILNTHSIGAWGSEETEGGEGTEGVCT